MEFELRLKQLNIDLPQLVPPIGNYLHGVLSGNLLFLSGKGPVGSKGKVGGLVTLEQAKNDAFQVGLYLLAAVRSELGTLDKVSRVVKLLGMVNCEPDFEKHPEVINGCSDLFVDIFGDKGRHARSSVGVNSLPRNITVEIEAIFEVK